MANISVRFFKKNGNDTKDIRPNKPHTGLHGEFVWVFKNELGRSVKIDVQGLDANFVEIDTPYPVTVDDGKKGVILATVVADEEKNKTVTYSIYLDGSFFDPDLIIDGS